MNTIEFRVSGYKGLVGDGFLLQLGDEKSDIKGPIGSGKTKALECLRKYLDICTSRKSLSEVFSLKDFNIQDQKKQISMVFKFHQDGDILFNHTLVIDWFKQEKMVKVITDTTIYKGSLIAYWENEGNQIGYHCVLKGEELYLPVCPNTVFISFYSEIMDEFKCICKELLRINIYDFDVSQIIKSTGKDSIFLDYNGANFATWVKDLMLSDMDASMDAQRYLRDNLPNFDSLSLILFGTDIRVLYLNKIIDEIKIGIPFEDISMNEKRVILLTFIFFAQALTSVLVIDHLELYPQDYVAELRCLFKRKGSNVFFASRIP